MGLEGMAAIMSADPSSDYAASYLLLRHAQTASSQRGTWHSAHDEALLPSAKAAVVSASRRLSELAGSDCIALVSSNLRRAVETAEVMRSVLALGPVTLDPLLRERDMGQWAGKSPTGIEAACPGVLAAWESGRLSGPPGGETDLQVAHRGLRALREYAHAEKKTVVVITHGGIIRSINGLLTGRRPRVPHLGGYWLTLMSDGTFTVGCEVTLDPAAIPLT
jgi:glucosyl-3-phosphoglycerate phosphatase